MTALRARRSDGVGVALSAGTGLLLGGLALAYQLRHKTTTELAIAAVAFAIVCVIVGNPRRFLLAVVVLDIPLEWGKNLFYQADIATKYGALSGLNVSGTTIALTGLYVLWALDRRARDGRAWRVRLAPALPLIAYLGVNVLSLLAAQNRTLGEYEIAMLAETLLLFIYIVSTVRTRTDVEFLVVAMLAGLIIESLVILFIYATGHSFHFLGIANRVDPGTYGGRIGGTVGSPNAAAAYMCLLIPLALAVLTTPVGPRLKQLALAAVALGVIALVITGSRGGWISLTISLVILAIWTVRRGFISPRTLTVAAVGVAIMMAPFWGPVAQRITGNDNGSASSRIAMTKLATDMITAHPALGLGVNNVGINIPNYAGPQFDGQFIYTIHDKYLLIWAEAGIGALLAFLWFLGVTLRRGWRTARSSDPLLASLALGLSAGIAGQLVHMAVDIFQSKPQVEGLWLAAAMLAAMELIVRRERHGVRLQSTEPPRRVAVPAGA
jgi:O-antigen ligase